jgi:hypothetical protein
MVEILSQLQKSEAVTQESLGTEISSVLALKAREKASIRVRPRLC